MPLASPAANQTPPNPHPAGTVAATLPSHFRADPPRSEEDPAGEPIIPSIQSLAPCIFVPLTEDPSAPFTPPTTRLEELHETLAQLDKHSAAVHNNLLNIFTRDAARIVQDARRQEAYLFEMGTYLADMEPGMSPSEVADMISNMEQPQDPSKDCNLEVIPQPDFINGVVLHNPREWAANHMLRLGVMSATDLEGYERHINELRSYYQQEIKKEMDRRPS